MKKTEYYEKKLPYRFRISSSGRVVNGEIRGGQVACPRNILLRDHRIEKEHPCGSDEWWRQALTFSVGHAGEEALRQYQSLYVGLGDDRGFELSKGFARSVIRKLPAEGEAKSRFSFLNVLLAILGFAAAAGGTLCFVDLKSLGKTFSHILPRGEFGAEVLDLVEGLLPH